MLCVLPSTEINFEIILSAICLLIIYFIQEENHKKDKQKRPTLAMRQQNRRFFRDIKSINFFFRKLNFFARTALFTLEHIHKV